MLHRNIFHDAIAKETAVSIQRIEGFEGVAVEPERALNIGLGVAQAPLWAAFYATAGLGAAWWWSTAWTRAVPSLNLAALLAPEPTPPAEAYIEALDEAVCDLIETSQDEAAEAVEVVEAVHDSVEFAAETTVEAVEFAYEQVEEAIAEAHADTAAVVTEAPVVAAAQEAEPVELAAVEAPAAETVAVEAAEIPAFKPATKKAKPAQA
jgi:hypothetical protein